MKSFKIKLKSGNFRRSFKGEDESVVAEILLENGRTLLLFFIPDKMKVEVRTEEKEVNGVLTEEERIAIIERILIDCATFLKSILKASISLYIEEYKLVDCTTGDKQNSNKTILEEFVSSKYASETQNKVLQNLLILNSQVEENLDKIGKETIEVKFSENLYIIDIMDTIYFFKHLLKRYADEITLDNKKNTLILKPIK